MRIAFRATQVLLSLLLLAPASQALAAIACTVTLTDVLVVYDPTSPTQNDTAGSWTINCTRLSTDPNTLSWRMGVNNGLHAGGGFNRVVRTGAQRYSYDTYRLPPYVAGNIWGNGNTTRFTGTLNFGAGLTASDSAPFYIVMNAGQTVQPAGTYTDTVTATLQNSTGSVTYDTSPFNVTVRTDNWCQISVPPGNVDFTYTSFQAAAANASTTYNVRCTTALPYTMALDATSGTLLGLTYNLAIAPSSAGTGNGEHQIYTINGTIAPGQAGTCASAVCTGSQARTLTLSW